MNEASKTRRVRPADFYSTYLRGRVIDIGCGSDLVVPHAEPFDRQHGDAGQILRHCAAGSYDCVHSSHCLEHMRDVPDALRQWWGLVKPGGYMVIVVPHEDLYEQGIWPSLFNPDHNATFRIGGSDSWSPVSYDIQRLIAGLPGAVLESAAVQDAGYDHGLRGALPEGRVATRFLQRLRYLLHRLGPGLAVVDHWLMRTGHAFGVPVDQTLGTALAQIQVVVRKAQ